MTEREVLVKRSSPWSLKFKIKEERERESETWKWTMPFHSDEQKN